MFYFITKYIDIFVEKMKEAFAVQELLASRMFSTKKILADNYF